jgi:uncharacterized protein (DUF433 family)
MSGHVLRGLPWVDRLAVRLAVVVVLDRVTAEPGKMGGRPCIRGRRFTVEQLADLVEAGWSLAEIQEDFAFIDAGMSGRR